MIPLVDVVALKPVGDCRLWVKFSDGMEGVEDFSDLLAEGGEMLEPLREPSFFARVFLSFGVPSWPNGFDIDAINLYMEMREKGLLALSDAA